MLFSLVFLPGTKYFDRNRMVSITLFYIGIFSFLYTSVYIHLSAITYLLFKNYILNSIINIASLVRVINIASLVLPIEVRVNARLL